MASIVFSSLTFVTIQRMFPAVVFAFALLSFVHAGNSSEFISRAEHEEMKLKFEERLRSLETREISE